MAYRQMRERVKIKKREDKSGMVSSLFVKSASQNPVLWTGMKDASAKGRKKQTRC
jgi:hypothetical protein